MVKRCSLWDKVNESCPRWLKTMY